MSRRLMRLLVGAALLYSAWHAVQTGLIAAWANFSGDFLGAWPGPYVLGWNPSLYEGSLSEHWSEGRKWFYGPVLHGLYLPLTWLPDLRIAYRVVLLSSYLYLAVAFLAVAVDTGARRRPALLAALFVLWANFFPLYEALLQRNIELFELMCLSLGYVLLRRGRDAAAGAAVGLAAMAKFLPGILLLAFLWQRRWRAVAGFCAVAVPIAVLTQVTLGWERNFLVDEMRAGLQGHEHFLNQALSGLVLRAGPQVLPALDWDAGARLARLAAALVMGAVVWRAGPRAAPQWTWSWLLLMVILLVPRAQPYYYVFLLLPFSWLLAAGWRALPPAARVLAGAAFVLIGWPVPLSVLGRLLPPPPGGLALAEFGLSLSLPVWGGLALAGALALVLRRSRDVMPAGASS